jgi:pyridinium-3,5-bisthiocarboxylic acid mononucleotide nickel chelatase
MTILYFDCFSGISGDMLLGALLDAGLPLDELRRALGSLTIPGCDVAAEKVSRAGIAATKFHVVQELDGPAAQGPSFRHDHGPGHHQHGPNDGHVLGSAGSDPGPGPAMAHRPHRSLPEIFALIETSALSAAGRARARGLFMRLAEAEAAIHQMPVDRVHLHEVGALDSIVDIVGAVFALEWLAPDEIVCSPLNVGGGMVDSAHGRLPVPAPATVTLLGNAPIYSSGQPEELVTPTGALLATSYASRFGSLPPMRVTRVGYGAGERNPPSTPNVLRVLYGDAVAANADAGGQLVTLLEFEVDDMNPQIFGPLMDALYAAGALEVFYVPVQMKKNRPGTLATIVARPADRARLSAIVFRETTTIGLRYQDVRRECLEREVREIQTPIGAVRFKISSRDGRVLNAAPEFDDCARLARERGLSIKDVQAIAAKAYLDGE